MIFYNKIEFLGAGGGISIPENGFLGVSDGVTHLLQIDFRVNTKQ